MNPGSIILSLVHGPGTGAFIFTEKSSMDENGLRKILRELNIKVANKSGKWLEFSCPFAPWLHRKGTDNSPSCAAGINNEGVSGYKCHACKRHGRISSLVRSLEYFRGKQYPGLAFEADLADATQSFGDFETTEEEPEELPPPLSEEAYANMYPSAWDVKEARDYLKDRGIGKQTVEYLNLGFDDDDLRIIFPVRHIDQRLYGFTGRSILPSEDFPKMYKNYKKVKDYLGLPKKHLLLGAELVDSKLPLLVVEGLFAFAHLIEIKADAYCNPVALLGSEMTDFKASLIREFDRLTILLSDNDEAGDTCLFGPYNSLKDDFDGGGAVDKLIRHVPLVVPDWPLDKKGKEKKDPDELTLAEVKEMLNAPLYERPTLTKKKIYGKGKHARE